MWADPETFGANRGLAWWDSGAGDRLFFVTSDQRLISLGQRLRRPIDSKYSNTSPPIVCGHVVIVGDVRGFDAHTGALR